MQRRVWWGFFVWLAILFVLTVVDLAPPQPQHQANYSGTPTETKNEPAPRTPDERIANYTWWLAVFTAVLGTVALVQIYFLIRADGTARISAEAANRSAKAIVANERPHILVTDLRVLSFVPTIPNANGMVEVHRKFELKNSGKTPAFVDEFCLTSTWGKLNPTPIYGAIDRTFQIIVPDHTLHSIGKVGGFFVPQSIVPRIIDDTVPVHFYGYLRYHNILEEKYIIRFCYRLVFNGRDNSIYFLPDGHDTYWQYT